uniref:4Fe-4S dicluster domain-containing protein n=1 Tax=Thermodesulfobacterium geofontis TaxID=1295609 RepID=A0A7V5XH12_9BACT
MKYPKIRELIHAIKVLIKGPATTKYPFEPYTPPEGFRGKPQPSQDGCIGCGACAEVCPAEAIHIKEKIFEIDGKKIGVRVLVWHYDECIFCGQCARYCTTREEKIPGVVMSREFDLATTNRKELKSEEIKKELVLCSYCGSVISTKEHLLYISKKLKYKTYGNINLIQTLSEKFGSLLHSVKFKQFNQREYLYEILCPKCRRRILLFDEYGKI